jgi:hypothetical protein
MNKLLFSIYTNKGGHQVHGFDPFDKDGKSAFDQAISYATTTYNDLNDIPRVFLLSEIPYDFSAVTRTPAEWEAVTGVEVINPDGWRGVNGKAMTVPITLAEFKTRCNTSTIFEGGHTKGGHKL